MPRFTKIPADTFDVMQLDAGMLLYDFDPANPAEPTDEDIITATTGGIRIDCIPSYIDMGEDVDNCPVNMLELKKHSGWDCRVGFSALNTSVKFLRLALGAADVDSASNKVTLRRSLDVDKDYSNVWWVGSRADGGAVAICLKNALSTGGLSLQTTKNGKTTIACELTGHVSIDEQDDMPMEFYVFEPEAA